MPEVRWTSGRASEKAKREQNNPQEIYYKKTKNLNTFTLPYKTKEIRMIFISLTRLRVKSYRYIIPFFLANESSLKQLRKTPGFLGGEELVDKNLTFWTLTMWTADSNMKEFRNSIPHRKAMQKLPIWCNEASYMHWTQSEPNLPDWKTAYHKMVSEGHISKVREPSEMHLSKQYPEMKWKGSARKIKGAGM